MTTTHTRTHTHTRHANPYLVCDRCGHHTPAVHDHTWCGCDTTFWNVPCGCARAGVVSLCETWGPVDECQCLDLYGHIPHPPVP